MNKTKTILCLLLLVSMCMGTIGIGCRSTTSPAESPSAIPHVIKESAPGAEPPVLPNPATTPPSHPSVNSLKVQPDSKTSQPAPHDSSIASKNKETSIIWNKLKTSSASKEKSKWEMQSRLKLGAASSSKSNAKSYAKSSAKSKAKLKAKTSTPASNRGKVAYLTFDDGPSNVTPRVLDTLKRHQVKATFFVIGNTTPQGIALYKRIVSEGHAIGNHSFSHNYREIYKSVSAFQRDIDKLNKLLEQTIQYRPDILRFPGGSNNTVSYRAGGRYIMNKITSDITERGYQYFDWNVNSTDASPGKRTKADIVASVKKQAANHGQIIVLLHDGPGRWSTAEALPEIISYLKSRGYRFEKLNKSAFTWHFLD